MQASKINIYGNLYFVPATHLGVLTLMEDYLEALNNLDISDRLVMVNSMFVVDDEKQRAKMTKEFYANYKSEIEFYQGLVQHFINGGCKSKTVTERWMGKIDALYLKKRIYEDVLKSELSALDEDFSILRMQSDELKIRSMNGQISLLGDNAA